MFAVRLWISIYRLLFAYGTHPTNMHNRNLQLRWQFIRGCKKKEKKWDQDWGLGIADSD